MRSSQNISIVRGLAMADLGHAADVAADLPDELSRRDGVGGATKKPEKLRLACSSQEAHAAKFQ